MFREPAHLSGHLGSQHGVPELEGLHNAAQAQDIMNLVPPPPAGTCFQVSHATLPVLRRGLLTHSAGLCLGSKGHEPSAGMMLVRGFAKACTDLRHEGASLSMLIWMGSHSPISTLRS